MEVFSCQACGQALYFENVRCERCGHTLGYVPEKSAITALEPRGSLWTALPDTTADRTLLGHFRHEIGHYFWNVLVQDSGNLETFHKAFGDEKQDYGAALQSYYSNGPSADWQRHFVTAYAGAHPWEDFAETWAHYLHIVDTLQTARAFGVKVQVPSDLQSEIETAIDFDPHASPTIEHLIGAWLPLCFAVNSLNRSMGHTDIYPFVLGPAAIGKLGYIHGLIQNR